LPPTPSSAFLKRFFLKAFECFYASVSSVVPPVVPAASRFFSFLSPWTFPLVVFEVLSAWYFWVSACLDYIFKIPDCFVTQESRHSHFPGYNHHLPPVPSYPPPHTPALPNTEGHNAFLFLFLRRPSSITSLDTGHLPPSLPFYFFLPSWWYFFFPLNFPTTTFFAVFSATVFSFQSELFFFSKGPF